MLNVNGKNYVWLRKDGGRKPWEVAWHGAYEGKKIYVLPDQGVVTDEDVYVSPKFMAGQKVIFRGEGGWKVESIAWYGADGWGCLLSKPINDKGDFKKEFASEEDVTAVIVEGNASDIDPQVIRINTLQAEIEGLNQKIKTTYKDIRFFASEEQRWKNLYEQAQKHIETLSIKLEQLLTQNKSDTPDSHVGTYDEWVKILLNTLKKKYENQIKTLNDDLLFSERDKKISDTDNSNDQGATEKQDE